MTDYERETERFISLFHSKTGIYLDKEMGVFYYELQQDRELYIKILNQNQSQVNDSFSDFKKSLNELQSELSRLTQVTDEKKDSFLSVTLRIYHRLSLVKRIIVVLLFISTILLTLFEINEIRRDFDYLVNENTLYSSNSSFSIKNGKRFLITDKNNVTIKGKKVIISLD